MYTDGLPTCLVFKSDRFSLCMGISDEMVEVATVAIDEATIWEILKSDDGIATSMKFDNVNRGMAAKKPVKSVLHIQSFCLPIFSFPLSLLLR